MRRDLIREASVVVLTPGSWAAPFAIYSIVRRAQGKRDLKNIEFHLLDTLRSKKQGSKIFQIFRSEFKKMQLRRWLQTVSSVDCMSYPKFFVSDNTDTPIPPQ